MALKTTVNRMQETEEEGESQWEAGSNSEEDSLQFEMAAAGEPEPCTAVGSHSVPEVAAPQEPLAGASSAHGTHRAIGKLLIASWAPGPRLEPLAYPEALRDPQPLVIMASSALVHPAPRASSLPADRFSTHTRPGFVRATPGSWSDLENVDFQFAPPGTGTGRGSSSGGQGRSKLSDEVRIVAGAMRAR
jgi:hypothetical protein